MKHKKYCFQRLLAVHAWYIITTLKKEKEFLQDVDSISLQQALRHLDTAFQNFFRDKKIGFPKFKSRKNKNTEIKFLQKKNKIMSS